MATLRIDDEDDDLLERIRAQYILKGIKKTKKEIIKELIHQEANELHELVNYEKSEDYKEDYAWLMLKKPLNWEVTDTSTTVDDYLYKNE